MRPGWKHGKYGSAHRVTAGVAMETAWGSTSGDKYTATCEGLGISLKGFESHEAAQEALEAEVEKRLEAALAALRGGK